MATEGQAMTPGQVRDQMRARPGFASKTAKALGITQLTCGILSIVFGIAVLFIPSGFSYIIYSPIVCGAMFILPGIFGIFSSKSKTNCKIIATMVMSILAAVIFAPVMLVLVIRELAIHTGRRCYDTETKTSRCEPRPEVAVSATLLCTVLVELIAAIWNARVCCRAVCCSCCRPQNETANAGTVHYVQSGQQVIIMTPTTTTNTGQTAYVVQAPAAVQYVAPKPQYPVQYGAQPVAAPAGGQNPGSYSMPQASPAPQNPEYTTLSHSGGANPPEYSAL